jgi:hypothetical protein
MRPGRGSWLIILLIAAIASSVIFMLAPARQPPAQTRLRTEQGYYVREGTLTGTGADGRILYRITTQAARQNLDDGTISMQEVAVNYAPAAKFHGTCAPPAGRSRGIVISSSSRGTCWSRPWWPPRQITARRH